MSTRLMVPSGLWRAQTNGSPVVEVGPVPGLEVFDACWHPASVTTNQIRARQRRSTATMTDADG